MLAVGMFAAAVLVTGAPGLLPAPKAGAVTLPSGLQTGFQIDGNKTAGSPPNTFDWDDILTPPQPDGSFTFTPTGPYTTGSGATSSGVFQGAFYWDNGTLDAACSGAEPTGQPGSQAPSTNPWVPGMSNPNAKSNLCSGGYAVEALTTPGGERHTILYGYFTRTTNNSSAAVYELFEGPNPGRCDDLLLEMGFPGGTPNFQTWAPTAGDDCANPLGAGTWSAAGRSVDFESAVGVRTEGPVVGGQQGQTFGEYAIDLTAAGLFGEETCSAFTVSTRFSRTGASPQATIQDFFLNTPEPLDISNCGTLTVTKQITPPGSTGDEFGFTVSSEEGSIQLGPPPVQQIVGSVGPGQTETYTGVRAGTRTHLDETSLPSPWVNQSVVCSYRDFAGVVHTVDVTDPATPFPILDDGRTDCVITNNAALVTVTKQTEPDGATGTFTFDVGGQQVTLNDGQSETIAFADGAQVTITEDEAEGWLAPDISCTADATTTDRSATITAALGQNINCTFTNTQLGTVIITKEAHGVDGRTFQFTGTFPGGEAFDVLVPTGDGTLVNTTFPNIPPGTYSITELADTGDPQMVVSDVACTFGGQDHSFPPEGRTGTFTVLPGETVRCFFTNSLPQQIFVIKRTLPVEFDHTFDFTVTPPVAESPFVLNGNSDGEPTGALWSSPPLAAGQYTITEAPQANWTLDDISCTADPQLWEPNLPQGQVTIDLPENETVTCFFTNRATPAQATVTKSVEGIADTLPWGFDVALSPGTDISPAPTQRLTGTGPGPASVTWTNLEPGQRYTITETSQPGWDMGPMTCSDQGGELDDLDSEPLTFTFVAQPGQLLDCEMTNTGIPPQLQLTKITSGIGFDYPWAFDFTIDPVPTGEIPQQSVDGAGQTTDFIEWGNLVPGQRYTITELGELAGMTASLSCAGGSSGPVDVSFEFVAPLGGTIACTATNIADPVTAQITKTTDGGDGSFTFTLTALETGQDPEVLEVTTNGSTGTGQFTTLVPGQRYSLVEDVGDGWDQGPFTCTATSLAGQTRPIPDLSDFTVDVGDSVACQARNTAEAPPPSTFAVTKSVTGEAASSVPAGTVFTVEYSVDGGQTFESLDVPLDETAVSPEFPVGTEVLVREGPLPEIESVEWGAPLLSVDGEPAAGDTVVITIGSDAPIPVGVENTANPSPPSPTQPPTTSPQPPPSITPPPVETTHPSSDVSRADARGRLPFTGIDPAGLLFLAVAIVAIGVMLLRSARHRTP